MKVYNIAYLFIYLLMLSIIKTYTNNYMVLSYLFVFFFYKNIFILNYFLMFSEVFKLFFEKIKIY